MWNGRTRTYDLRGKKFCVVMAGNPYTESGERFQIPDMLANRADTYNLGDILDGKEDLFALSYLENALTSNPALAPLATRDPADVAQARPRWRRARRCPRGELSHGYSAAELEEIVAVLQRLFRVQKVLLKVNQEYIALGGAGRALPHRAAVQAAGQLPQHEQARREGRRGDERRRARAAASTITTRASRRRSPRPPSRTCSSSPSCAARLTPEKATRWEEIKQGFARVKRMGGKDDDPVARVTAAFGGLGDELSGIRDGVLQAAKARTLEVTVPAAPQASAEFGPEALAKLDALREALLEIARSSIRPVPAAPVVLAPPLPPPVVHRT